MKYEGHSRPAAGPWFLRFDTLEELRKFKHPDLMLGDMADVDGIIHTCREVIPVVVGDWSAHEALRRLGHGHVYRGKWARYTGIK